MKFSCAIFALASVAIGSEHGSNWGEDGHHEHPTMTEYHRPHTTTYTTVTTCPITHTMTEHGSTWHVTDYTTSTKTVTKCIDCTHVQTLPGKTVVSAITKEVEVTYTTHCPTTETVYGPTSTYLKKHTLTSTVVTHVPTTIYKTVPGHDVTKTEVDVHYSTYTTVQPTTVVTSIEGTKHTVTFKTTQVLVTEVPQTIVQTHKGEDKTSTAVEEHLTTVTKVQPVTQVTTIDGKETTVTHKKTKTLTYTQPWTIVSTYKAKPTTFITTEYIHKTLTKDVPVEVVTSLSGKLTTITHKQTEVVVTEIPKTIVHTVKGPDTTVAATDILHKTITKEIPVTEVVSIGGKKHTITHTETQVLVTEVPKTILQTHKEPDTTQTNHVLEHKTIVKEIPVTEVVTVGGQKHTVTHTETKTYVTEVPKVIYQTHKEPDTTNTAVDVVHKTITKEVPVTHVTVIGGHKQTVTLTETKVYVTEVPKTVLHTQKEPDTTDTAVDVVHKTITKEVPVTHITVIGGHKQTVTLTETKVYVTEVPKTVVHTQKQPDTTDTAVNVIHQTITKEVPFTHVTVIGGHKQTVTLNETKVYVTEVPKTVLQTQKAPDTTDTAVNVIHQTITKEVPVTHVTTIGGHKTTVTLTETKVYVTEVPKTVVQTHKEADTTATHIEYKHSTCTKEIPVTQVTTIGGQEHTITFTKTKVFVTEVPKTILETLKGEDTTAYATDVDYSTVIKDVAVTKVTTIAGKPTTITEKVTKVVEIQKPHTEYATVTQGGNTWYETQTEYVTKNGGGVVTNTVTVPGSKATQTIKTIATVGNGSGAPSSTVMVTQTATMGVMAVPTAAAHANQAPVAAFVAGIAGILAVF